MGFISSLLEPGKVSLWLPGPTEYSRSDAMLLPRLDHKSAMHVHLLLSGCSRLESINHAMGKLRLTHGESTYRGMSAIPTWQPSWGPSPQPASSAKQVSGGIARWFCCLSLETTQWGSGHRGAEINGACCALIWFLTLRMHEYNRTVVLCQEAMGWLHSGTGNWYHI